MKIDHSEIRRLFPELKNPQLLEQIAKNAVIKGFEAGEILVGQGDIVGAIPLLIYGSVKVIREDDSDREILMYHIEPGESCVLSLSALLAFRKSKVTAIVDSPTTAILLSANLVFRWMSEFEEWMKFVFGLFDKRMSEMIMLVEAVAFKKTDERLWNHLVRKVQRSAVNELKITHQELALELGTVREVISRLLKGLEKDGKVKLGRGKVTILRSSD